MNKPINRLDVSGAALAVVDIQERLVPAMFERERLVRKAVQLIRGCSLLNIPTVATEQYPKGIGPTIKEVASAIPTFAPMEKLDFSSCGAPAFVPALRTLNASSVILCGIEAHVCVTQTCLDLLRDGFQVFVASDATSSRSPEDWRAGIERMRSAGAVTVSVEMALFELLKTSGRPEFKGMLGIVK